MGFVVLAAFILVVWALMEIAVFGGEGIEWLWRKLRGRHH